LFAVARLRAGVDMAAAQAELHVLARAIRERVPDLNRDRSIHAQNAGKLMAGMTSTVRPLFFLLMGITFLVLFAACANIANLMLARASARTREIATRLAVGASRSRLLRQLITEGVFLGVAGGALGVALSELAGSQLSHFRLPVPIPIDINVSADGRVLGFAVTLSIITGVIFSLIPAWRATKPDLIGSIKNDTGSIASMRRFGLRNVLVVVQIGISTIETHIRESMILPRLAAILFGLCGGIGLLIASIGV
jgi:ABC-type lipoprotein release transport system permease subunit